MPNHELFKTIDPGIFCPRKLYEVVFANVLTDQCSELMNGILNIHNEYKENSNTIFITRTSISKFLKEIVSNYDNEIIEHPPQITDHLRRVCNDLDNCLKSKGEISRKQLALLLKHKLINEMYIQYAKDAKTDHDLCEKEELLKRLQKAENQKQIRFSQMGMPSPELKKKSPSMKKLETVSEFRMNDYTSYALPENLHGSDDLKDHVYFYVFVGFQDPCLLKLLMRYKVPVNCILQISRTRNVDNSDLNYFWKKVNEIGRDGDKYQILEDAAQLRYVHEEKIPEDENKRRHFFKKRYNEFEDLLMNILDLKIKHMHYIKHLLIHRVKDKDIKFGPFPTYEKNLEDIPSEYITIPYILQSMLLEIEKNLACPHLKNLNKSTSSTKLCSPNQKNTQPSCRECNEKEDMKDPCPFSLKSFGTMRKKRQVLTRKSIFRKFYEGDVLNMNLVADQRTLSVVLSDTKSLMNQRFFNLIRAYRDLKDTDDSIPHLHHQGTPSSQKSLLSNNQTNHFLNLLYLSSMKITEKTSKVEDDTAKNIFCSPYDIFENENFLPKCSAACSSTKQLTNWYSKFDSMRYRWKEPLTSSTLAQWLFEAEQEFVGVNSRYCESTDTLVVYFHRDLEPTGTRTKIWRESLRTIVCFRDFCNFYYAEDARWFSKFQPLKHISHQAYVETEEKYVFERIIESNDQYKEYEKYLFPYNYCDNFDITENSTCTNTENIKNLMHFPPISKPNLEDIIEVIKNYPSSNHLVQHCSKSFPDCSLLAYNDKPPRFGLTGGSHEFFSHDGVQVIVDTCRFHFEDFKLSLKVKFDGHTLIGHYKKYQLDPHLVLKDGTVVKLILPIPKNIKYVKDIDSCINSYELDQTRSIFTFNSTRFFDTDSLERASITKSEEIIPQVIPETKHVIPVWTQDLEKINVDISLLWNRVNKIPYERNVNRDIKILKHMKDAEVVHKYMGCDRLRYVKRKYKFLEIPYSFYIRRILNNPIERKCKPIYRRKFRVKGEGKFHQSHQNNTPHIKLSLPNGLILESLLSDRNQEDIVIKQTHLHRDAFKSIVDEDYRLFLDHGTIFIRYSDGNIRILDSQGTILDFRQKRREEYDGQKCLKSMDTCRKMIYKMSLSPNNFCHNIQDYSRSRRGHLDLSKELKLKSFPPKDISNLCDLYSSIRMYTAEGAVLRIGEKVRKKRFAKVLKDWDFLSGQMLFERTDGMVIWTKDDGDHVVVFPDGTKITKTVDVENTPEMFTQKDKEGWVLVSHNYLYEHPLFCPIRYESKYRRTTVKLKADVEILMTKKSTSVSFGGKNEMLINAERINLTKICPKCGSQCTCDITINTKCTDDECTELLMCKDSYKKVFTADFSGRCHINNDFIKDELNSENCNHVLKNDYHKVFLIKDDMSGDILCDENMIMREINKLEDVSKGDSSTCVLEQFADVVSDSVGISLTKSFYENLNSKFLWEKYIYPIEFPKLASITEENITYQVYRRIFNILGEKETIALYGVITKLLAEDNAQPGHHKI